MQLLGATVMMDKIEKLEILINTLQENSAPEYREHTDRVVKSIKKLLAGCIDNDTVLVLYDREQLDDWKSQFTDEPATDEEWNNFRNHKDVDYAYEHASEYLNGAESNVIDEDKYLD